MEFSHVPLITLVTFDLINDLKKTFCLIFIINFHVCVIPVSAMDCHVHTEKQQ